MMRLPITTASAVWATRRAGEFGAFLGRIVDDDEAVDARGFRRLQEFLRAHRFDRIGAAHQHDRRRVVGFPEPGDELEYIAQADAMLKGALAGALDHRAV